MKVAATMLLVLFASACSSERPGPVTVADLAEEEGPAQESWNVEYYVGEDGSARAIVRAARMARFEDPDSAWVVMEGTEDRPVTARVFGADGTGSDVSSSSIRYFEESRLYELTGNVSVATSSGRTLRAETLVWDEPNARIRSDGFVQIESADEYLQGYGLDADEMLESFTIRRATGRKYVEEADDE